MKVAAMLLVALLLLSSQMDTVQSANNNCYENCMSKCSLQGPCDRKCSNQCPPHSGNTNHGCLNCCRCCVSRTEKMSFENLKYQGGEYNVDARYDNGSGGGGRGGGGSRGCSHGCCGCC